MPAWLYSFATRKLLAWVRKAAVGHLLLESANPVWGHESDMNRRAQDFGTTNQTDVEFKLVQHFILGLKQTLELEINNNQRALKIMDKNPSLGKNILPKELFGVVRLPPAPSPQQFAQQAWYPQGSCNPLGFSSSPPKRRKDPKGSKQGMLFSSWKVFSKCPRYSDGASALPREEYSSFSGFLSGKPWGPHSQNCQGSWHLVHQPKQTLSQKLTTISGSAPSQKTHVAACSWPLQHNDDLEISSQIQVFASGGSKFWKSPSHMIHRKCGNEWVLVAPIREGTALPSSSPARISSTAHSLITQGGASNKCCT